MKNRPAIEARTALALYNIALIALNLYIFSEVSEFVVNSAMNTVYVILAGYIEIHQFFNIVNI